MPRVAASAVVRNFGRYREEAQREPVAIIVHDRVGGYLISEHLFNDYQRLKAMETRAFAVEELDDEALSRIEETRMDSRHDHLNALMD